MDKLEIRNKQSSDHRAGQRVAPRPVRKFKPLQGASAMALVALLAIASAGCGDNSASDQSSGNMIDAAFVSQMIPHHESAVEMAKIAKLKAQHEEITTLANSISESQTAEIAEMREMQTRFKQSDANGSAMGMDEEAMGMNMDPSSLEAAKPFDREFIDMMIPHHRGAIAMANMQLAKGSDADVKQLSREIIAAQNKEIAQMQAWRKDWYGSELEVGASKHGGSMYSDPGGDDHSANGHSMK